MVRSETAADLSAGEIIEKSILVEEIAGESGNCFLVDVIDVFGRGDNFMELQCSDLELFENGARLGSPHSEHQLIRQQGRGLFSHWNGYVYFSSSDNTSPLENGRAYVLRGPAQPARRNETEVKGLAPDDAGIIDAAFCDRLAASASPDPAAPISMLSSSTLALLRGFALATDGPIIEIGSYIGGATVVLGRSLAERGEGKLICVEVGGAYPNHRQIPSTDIIRDWRANLIANDLPLPPLVEGFSWSPRTIQAVANELGGEKAGLIIIDADGFPGLTLIDFAHLLRTNCLVVIDDYVSPGAPTKARVTKRQVDRAAQRGELETFGIYPWGTWFGRLRRPLSAYVLGLLPDDKWIIDWRPPSLGRQGAAYIDLVPVAAANWQLVDDSGVVYTRSSALDVIARGDGRYAVLQDDGGALLFFAPPGNPDELAESTFEMRDPLIHSEKDDETGTPGEQRP
jgi:hypothetical protein